MQIQFKKLYNLYKALGELQPPSFPHPCTPLPTSLFFPNASPSTPEHIRHVLPQDLCLILFLFQMLYPR